MNIKVLSYTPMPVDLISRAAGTCYGKDDSSTLRVRRALSAGHMSVFEHAAVTLRIDGISRACSHQLVRHRMASYSQESQRYCKVAVDNNTWYVIPHNIRYSEYLKDYVEAMHQSASKYQYLLDAGVSAEDARYVLPNAATTTIVMSMNVRELYHFIGLRIAPDAQWEIRELAQTIIDTLSSECDEQWGWLIGSQFETE